MATLKKKPISLLIRYAGDRLKAFGIGKKNLETVLC